MISRSGSSTYELQSKFEHYIEEHDLNKGVLSIYTLDIPWLEM